MGWCQAHLPRSACPLVAFNVGQQIPTLSASIYEIDDFRLLTPVATPAEVAAWAAASTAADAPYGAGCGATLTSSNGPPTLGNGTHGLTVSGPTGAITGRPECASSGSRPPG